MNDTARILSVIEQGDLAAAGQLLPLVYEEVPRETVSVRACGRGQFPIQPVERNRG